MSYSEDYDWRCTNCGGFHEHGNCPYYEDESRKNQPRTCWEGYENSNSRNPPHHQYYGEYEHQPLVQEEPHQRQGSGGKKSLRELLEGYITRDDENKKNQEAGKKSLRELLEGYITRDDENKKNQEAEIKDTSDAIKGLEIQLQELSKQIEEANQVSPLKEEVIILEEQGEELQIEEKETCELIKESFILQALEEDEEVEIPKEASEVVLELECEKMVDEQEEQVVECEELKEVPIVDFVFGDKLMIDEEKPLNISTYLMNSWSKGVQGKEQAQIGNIFSSTWNQIRENFLTPLIIYLINLADRKSTRLNSSHTDISRM